MNILNFHKSYLFIVMLFISQSIFSQIDSIYLFDVNNLDLPIDNKGILAHINDDSQQILPHGRYNGNVFLFSGGFALTGLHNDSVWSNGMLSASKITDYVNGKYLQEPVDSHRILFVLKNSDEPFSESWQNWKLAVQQGAKFYDGNNDGVYDPVDLNSNGEWDLNEDRPDLIADRTVWCLYNDGVPSSKRLFKNVEPKGIEIKQTIFGYQSGGSMGNIIFIRYEIENTGEVAEIYDSVYFSSWTDPDLGDYKDDLIGSDTTLHSGFAYNSGVDIIYGNNPPSFFVTLLQGPNTYIEGKTFLDVDGNNKFDIGTDLAIQTATINSGPILGQKLIPGATNLSHSSIMHYINGDTLLSDPEDKQTLRNYMKGRDKNGNLIDPCNRDFGNVFDLHCRLVNPRFMYSGDPVTKKGWVTSEAQDQRLMLNSGPFTLQKNYPIEIIIAYTVSRGNSAMKSFTEARENVNWAKALYESNFGE